ncbi:MAG: hypothetical protein ACHWZW_03060 [Spirulina sp.]
MANRTFTLPNSDAHLRLYKRLYLWDKEAILRLGRAFAHCDRARFGMPPYHAQLNAKLQSPPLPINVFNGGGRHAMGFFRPDNAHSRYWATMELGRSMTYARDRVMIRTRQTIPVTAGDRISSGAGILAGQFLNRDTHD